MNRPPNILLLSIDTLRADMLGRAPSVMPNLEALADNGINFTQAITTGSWTQAAFPGLLSSTSASMYGGCLGPLAPERPSPVKALAAHGYTTAAFSTSPLLSRIYAYDRGFHSFQELEPGESDPSLRRIKGGQRLLRCSLTHQIAAWLGQDLRPANLYTSASEVNAFVSRWLDNVQSPFFAWVHYMDVHWPYHLYESLTRPEDIAQVWHDLTHLHEVNFHNGCMTPAQRDYYIHLYEQAVQYTDVQIGKLLRHLERTGLADDTMVIVVSDHGEEFLERRHWGHVEINLYDEIIKVPLIMRIPGGPKQFAIERQVSLLDVMPTVLELCACPLPENMLGESLTPLWKGSNGQYESTVAISERWRHDSHIVAVRTETFKYIWNSEQPDQSELFNLQADPGEKNNVITQHPEVISELHAYVEAHLRRMNNTRPVEVVSKPQLDDEVVARLRDLGYVE